MALLSETEITLNGQSYIIAREDSINKSNLQRTRRRWNVKRNPTTTRVDQRADVRKGDLEEEYLITWDDWSRGVTGDHDSMVGTIHDCQNVDPTSPGSLRSVGNTETLNMTAAINYASTDIIEFPGGGTFALMGRYIMKYAGGGTWSVDHDFLQEDSTHLGSGTWATDAVIWGNKMYVAFDPQGVEGATHSVGSGLDDVSTSSSGLHTVGTCKNYKIKVIDGAASPNTFAWSSDGGSTWSATVNMSSPYTLENGIIITFGALTGHTTNDQWSFCAAPRIRARDTSGNWTRATQLVTAKFFSIVMDKLWRVEAIHKVSNIDVGDDPFTLANWTSGITIGESSIHVTDLNSYGEKLGVSKEDGLFLGDSKAKFPNVLPQIYPIRDDTNGRNTLERGADIFYAYRGGGLIRYTQGDVEEIGIKESLFGANASDDTLGYDISALTSEGEYVWAATAPLCSPRVDPTKVLKTTDNEVNFTDYTTNSADNIESTAADLSSLSTAANGDYFYVGYSANTVYGIQVEIQSPNTVVSALTVQYWNGTAWAAPAAANPAIDLTTTLRTGKTLSQSGLIFWEKAIDNGQTAWATKTINGTSAYWLRFSVSVALSSSVLLREIRVLTSQPRSSIYRGRPRELGDSRKTSIIWEPIYSVLGYVTDIKVLPKTGYGYYGNRSLVVLTWTGSRIIQLSGVGADVPLDSQSGSAIFFKHDGGMPNINKQFIDLTIKGKVIDSSHTVDVDYRPNETTAWTSLISNATASPTTGTFSSVTGRSIQIRVTLDDISDNVLTEINEVEIRFRTLYSSYKNTYTMILELADNQVVGNGGLLPEASVQLTNLEALQGAGPVAMFDPLGRSKTVTVANVSELEYVQVGVDYPSLLVEVVATEV